MSAMLSRVLGRAMTDDQAAARALVMKCIAIAPNASPRQKAIASRFSELYEAFRDVQGLTAGESARLAAEETRPYAEALTGHAFPREAPDA